MNSNPQLEKFDIVIGALGYRTRSDKTATPQPYLVEGSQNVLINEATDKQTDKIESRPGYTLKGASSTDRDPIISEFVFKTKVGTKVMGRFDELGNLEFYSETSQAWETLKTGLNAGYPLRTATAWNATELLRILLLVNHDTNLYEWSGGQGTFASDTAGPNTIVLNETIATQGFLANGTRTIRVKDDSGTWRTFDVVAQATNTFTVTQDPTAYSFTAGAIVVDGVRANATTPAAGFINDIIGVLDNHVYVGSHTSSVVYMSKSTSYIDSTFSAPRLATDGWQFVMDDFMIGFATNIASGGQESMVFFAGDDWIYRVEFVDLGDATISQIAKIKPIIVSSGQGAVSQELIAKVKNSIIFLNSYNELLELGSVENIATLQQTPLSDPIKPDFLAADFTGGAIRFWRNNLYVTAPPSGRMFILAYRDDERGFRRFWQPPQILPIGCMSDYNSDLIGHSSALKESYVMFDGTNDNGQPISFKVHYAYENHGLREKLKNYDKYFSEIYITSNATIRHILVYEYLAAKALKQYEYKGTETAFIFVPNPLASLGVNSLGTSPLGASIDSPPDFLKYRRFKKVAPIDFFEEQCRYECDDIDAQFQILARGPNVEVSKNGPVKITN